VEGFEGCAAYLWALGYLFTDGFWEIAFISKGVNSYEASI